MQILDLKDQGQGVKVVHELGVDFAVQVPGPAVLLAEVGQRACLAGRLVAELGGPGLACVTIDIRPAQGPGYELPEGFVFFCPSSGPPLVMESASQASRISILIELGSLSLFSRVQGTSSFRTGDLTYLQSTTM